MTLSQSVWFLYIMGVAIGTSSCMTPPTREDRGNMSPFGFDVMTTFFIMCWPAVLAFGIVSRAL